MQLRTPFKPILAIPPTAAKEWLSMAYMQATCAQAGLSILDPRFDDGIDMYVGSSKDSSVSRTRNQFIALQVKSTASVKIKGDCLLYPLRQKNYDELIAESAMPQYLVLFVLPEKCPLWMQPAHKGSTIRYCAYYLSLDGFAKTKNTTTTQVMVPRSQMLTAASLQSLFASAARSWRAA